MEKFEDHLEKKTKRRSKRKLNNQTQLNSEAEVLLKQKKKFRKIETAITKIDILSESSTTKSHDVDDSLVSGATATSVAIGAPSVTTTNIPVSSNSTKTSKGINIRDIIHNAAVILHSKYQNDENLTSSELKTMACGLSSILDINSDEVNGSQQSLFDEVLWKKIYSKYTKKHKLNLPPIPTEIDQQWNLISSLCKNNNDSRKARHFICKLKLASTTVKQERTLDFLNEVLFQIESKQFMFNENNSNKISERDYAYQLWLPVLNKLFFINNMVRIKIGETVLAGTTFAKSLLYEDSNNVVGFKVDVRILVDYKDEEFDLMCGEACHHDASDIKSRTDASKLIREGKEMQRNLAHIFYDENNVGNVWMIQIKGTKCSFSTIHPTPYHYHVNVPQFEISFPTSYSLLDEINYNFIGPLLAFKASIEKLAVEVENKLKRPVPNRSPNRNQNQPPEPTWFTPPRNNYSISRIPVFETFDSDEVFDSDDNNDESENADKSCDQPDEFGFVKKGER
ncbi:hypothetical protein G6F56_004824 [Rhizopus delemar]|nr:hypothetical protein G6F56_004824 [Rhizopus delemar]